MKVEILKDHDSGLKKGQVKNLSVRDARALINMGLAKDVNAKAKTVEVEAEVEAEADKPAKTVKPAKSK